MKYDLSTASFYLPKGLKQNGSESGCRCEEVREDDCQTIEDRQCKWPASFSTFFFFLLFFMLLHFYTFTLFFIVFLLFYNREIEKEQCVVKQERKCKKVKVTHNIEDPFNSKKIIQECFLETAVFQGEGT